MGGDAMTILEIAKAIRRQVSPRGVYPPYFLVLACDGDGRELIEGGHLTIFGVPVMVARAYGKKSSDGSVGA